MGADDKNFSIMGLHWKIWFLGRREFIKNQKIGRIVGADDKNFSIMGLHWKSWFLGRREFIKNEKIGRIVLKEGLGS